MENREVKGGQGQHKGWEQGKRKGQQD